MLPKVSRHALENDPTVAGAEAQLGVRQRFSATLSSASPAPGLKTATRSRDVACARYDAHLVAEAAVVLRPRCQPCEAGP